MIKMMDKKRERISVENLLASYLSPTGRTIQKNSALWNILAENQNNQQKN
jgi:hypothetical protein